MGLLYTGLYIDFDSTQWQQVSNDPVRFCALSDGVALDVEDTSHKSYRLVFKKDGAVSVMRVTGKFRITWDDSDVVG